MEKSIELGIKIEIKKGQLIDGYCILGKYGDRLPKDVQTEMRTELEKKEKELETLRNKLHNLYK